MAKIPQLHPQRKADGTISWNWKPSPRQRAAGWQNLHCGIGPAPRRGRPVPPPAVVEKAAERNRQLDQWDLGCAAVTEAAPLPRAWRWSDLVDAFRASPAYRTAIAAATRKEYDSRIRQLTFWAQDGALPIRAIDADMVRTLHKALVPDGKERGGLGPQVAAGDRPKSIFKAAAMLRVLRLLLRWAVAEGALDRDPTAAVAIPTTPSRATKLTWRETCDLAERADTPAIAARALRLAWWTMQRRADLVQLNRLAWRELHGADPRDLPALVNAKGEVWGFRLQQHKTGRWVDCPMPPFLHAEVEAAFGIGAQVAGGDSAAKGSQWLFPHPTDPTLAMSADVLRRRVKPVLVAGGFPGHQLRDLRRSGMSGCVDMGAQRGDVFAISGHPLDGQRRTMADVYMPPDTRAACRAIAAACRTLTATATREKEQADV